MENPKEQIAKALAALRDTTAPSGLENRVLRAVRNHALQPQPSLWSALIPAWISTRLPASASLACVVLLAGLLSYSLVSHPPRQSRAHGSTPIATLTPRPASVEVAIAQLSSVNRSAPAYKAAALKGNCLRQHKSPVQPGSLLRSFPAPPLPLTEQEKLLLKVAHTRTPSAIAPLEAETQIAQVARDKEEFSKFFNQQ